MIAIDTPMPNFSLENVLGKTVSLGDFAQVPVILLFSTQQSIKVVDEWYQQLQKKFSSDVVGIIPIGVLNKLPSFVPPSAIKVRLKKQSSSPLLLDIKGTIAKQFGITEDGAYVVVADASHVIRFTALEVNDNVLDIIQELLS